ncbi:MAG TPA: TonB family protein [Steroidobacteraceae bacterium]|nr:TonB family protein [Steroidobacteraceae bacterium]
MLAVTSHDDFLLELGEALGGQVAVRPVESVAAALEHVAVSRKLQLLMIDSRGLADLRAEVERVHTRAPQVPVVVFAAAESEKGIAGALRSSTVFAVLPIPVDRRKTAAIFEGALAEAAEKRGGQRGASSHPRGADARAHSRPPLVPEPAATTPALEDTQVAPVAGSTTAVRIGAIVAVAAIVVAGAVWFFLSGGHSAQSGRSASASSAPAPERTPQSPTAGAAQHSPASTPAVGSAAVATAVPAAQGNLDELLEKARLAMRERRYTEPTGNSALLYYRSALGVDSSNGEARDGMARLAGLLGSRFDEALAAGRYEEAAEALAGLKVAAPGDARLGARQTQLLRGEWSSALASGNTDRAATLLHQVEQGGSLSSAELSRWRAELARHQIDARAQHLAELLDQRIREGRLVEPGADSAKSYLQQLEQAAPQSAIAEHGARAWVAACLHKARDAVLAGRSADADKWVGEARTAGMTAAEFAAYQRDLASARQRAATLESDRLAQLARARIQDGHLTDPAQDSAVHYLDQLKSSYGDSSTVDSIGRELAARLVEQAAHSARAGQVAAMNSELALAQRWGADPALVQAVQQVVSGHGAATAPASPGAGPRIPPGFAPKRIRYEAPDYPAEALDQRISGSVTVGFTLDLQGHPRDVHVIESTPPDLFDRAAVWAVSRWRYEPVVIDNVPTQMPWRIVIHFAAPKD